MGDGLMNVIERKLLEKLAEEAVDIFKSDWHIPPIKQKPHKTISKKPDEKVDINKLKIKDIKKIEARINFHLQESGRCKTDEEKNEGRAALLCSRIAIEYMVQALCILNFKTIKKKYKEQILIAKKDENSQTQSDKKEIKRWKIVNTEHQKLLMTNKKEKFIDKMTLDSLMQLLCIIGCLDSNYNNRKRHGTIESILQGFTKSLFEIKDEINRFVHATIDDNFKLLDQRPNIGHATSTLHLIDVFIDLFGEEFK